MHRCNGPTLGADQTFTQQFIDFFSRGFLIDVQAEDGQTTIGHRDTDSVCREFVLEFWNYLGYRLAGTRFGDHHVDGCRPTPPGLLVHIVQQVLIVGVSMHRFDVAFIDSQMIVNHLEYRHNRVGGAGG